MNTIQSALKNALPKEIENIRRQAAAAAFNRNAKLGEGFMLEATQHSVVGNAVTALAAVRKDRHACACFLAKSLNCGIRDGYTELELMEQFWKEKVGEQKEVEQRRSAVA